MAGAGNLKSQISTSETLSIQNRQRIIDFKSLKHFHTNINLSIEQKCLLAKIAFKT